MTNTYVNSDANSYIDSDDGNDWGTADFYIKTVVVNSINMPYTGFTIATNSSQQIYSICEPLSVSLQMIYGLKLGTEVSFYYDDIIKPVAFNYCYYRDAAEIVGFNQLFYDDAAISPRTVQLPYEDILASKALVIMPYTNSFTISQQIELPWLIMTDVIQSISQIYSLTEYIVTGSVQLPYNLEQYNRAQQHVQVPYHLLSGATMVNTPTVTVQVGGNFIDFLSLNLQAGTQKYCIVATLKLPSENEYAQCNYLDEAICTVNSTEFTLFVEGKSKQMSNKSSSYTVKLLSPTAKLDSPYTGTIIQSFENGIQAQTLIQQMATIEGVTVDYQILDWFIPSHAISINDETPLAVIRKVVNAVGGIIQSKPNGDMLIISNYPSSPPNWDAEIPTDIFQLDEDILSISEDLVVHDGHNAFIITDRGSSFANIILKEENIDATTKYIKGFRIPFEDGEFDLETSGGIVVSMDKYQYPIEEVIPTADSDDEWEIVEFIDWVGNTNNPIYATVAYPTGIVDYDWIEEDLGAFQIAEDGTLTIIDQDVVPGESLLRIKYTTKYWRWTVTGPVDKEVQFYVPEEV